jgi:ABC-type bacteriocin/lantibiotic exporter with double-glycine peptidase domain
MLPKVLKAWLILAALVVYTAASAVTSRSATHEGDDPVDYRQMLACGPNALYMFLVIAGYGDSVKSGLPDLPVSERGTSMLQLQQAAAAVGVKTEILLVPPENFRRLKLPALVHSRGSGINTVQLTHFDVAFRLDGNSLHVLDGTTARRRVIPLDFVGTFSTGYVLVPKNSISFADVLHMLSKPEATIWLCLGILCFVVLLYVVMRLKTQLP